MKTKIGVISGLVFVGLSLVFTVQAIGRPISEPAGAVVQAPAGAGYPALPVAPDAPAADGLTLGWMSEEWDATYAVAWADYDRDGVLDLAVGNAGQNSRLYRNYGAWSGGLSLAQAQRLGLASAR